MDHIQFDRSGVRTRLRDQYPSADVRETIQYTFNIEIPSRDHHELKGTVRPGEVVIKIIILGIKSQALVKQSIGDSDTLLQGCEPMEKLGTTLW